MAVPTGFEPVWLYSVTGRRPRQADPETNWFSQINHNCIGGSSIFLDRTVHILHWAKQAIVAHS